MSSTHGWSKKQNWWGRPAGQKLWMAQLFFAWACASQFSYVMSLSHVAETDQLERVER